MCLRRARQTDAMRGKPPHRGLFHCLTLEATFKAMEKVADNASEDPHPSWGPAARGRIRPRFFPACVPAGQTPSPHERDEALPIAGRAFLSSCPNAADVTLWQQGFQRIHSICAGRVFARTPDDTSYDGNAVGVVIRRDLDGGKAWIVAFEQNMTRKRIYPFEIKRFFKFDAIELTWDDGPHACVDHHEIVIDDLR